MHSVGISQHSKLSLQGQETQRSSDRAHTLPQQWWCWSQCLRMLWTDLQWSPLPWRDTQTQLTLFIHSGQSVYTEIHLQSVSQCSTTVDNMFTRRDTYRQPHNVQHDGGQSFYTERHNLTLFNDSGQSVYTERHLQHHTVQRRWTICLHGETLTDNLTTTVDNLFTRTDTYRQPHDVQHDDGQSFDPWYLRLWMYLRRGETDREAQRELTLFKDWGHCVESSHCSRTVDTVLRAHTVQGLWTLCWELTLFKDCGHCVEGSHCSRTVDTVLRAHTVQGLWTLCCQRETQSSRCSLATVSQSMDSFTKRWDTPTQTELALFNDYGQYVDPYWFTMRWDAQRDTQTDLALLAILK